MDYCTEITVHFLDGRNESYTVYDPVEEGHQGFQARVQKMLEQDWWILHLSDQTVMLNLSNVIKIEVRPSVSNLQGEAVLKNVDRATALRRGRKIMSALTDDE
ncbi:MAG: hypothetical protein ACFB5Z_09745 [Elainellaceae cyanobacterium]